jgi:hypothetical protein
MKVWIVLICSRPPCWGGTSVRAVFPTQDDADRCAADEMARYDVVAKVVSIRMDDCYR